MAGRRRWLLAGALIVAAAGAYAFADHRGYACATADGDDQACQRIAADRAAITDPGPIGLDGTADVMLAAISRAVLCPPPALPNSCPQQPDQTATEADVVSARSVLVAAGLPGSIVRIARPDDPAPAGALVFALPMGDGCVVGYLQLATGRRWHEVGGLLPGHRCLT